MWVKICGNTNLEDAQAAAELGADALGFIFAPSVRHITPVEVGAMAAHLPEKVERIGVFLPAPASEIADAAAKANLTGVQIHGLYDPQLSAALREALPATLLIQTIHRAADEGENDSAENLVKQIMAQQKASRVLIDSKVGLAVGGTGLAFDWKTAAHIFAHYPLILAGGLNPENVRKAITLLGPWGVDLVSGVEKSPGKKDYAKMAHFIKEARRVG